MIKILEKIIKIIDDEIWHPMIHPTDQEMFASKYLNQTLENIKEEIKKLFIN